MKKYSYKKTFELRGKNAVVTGGAGILGSQFCMGLADFGANVAVVDADARSSKDLARDIAKIYKVKTVGISCDVSDPDSVRKMAQVAERSLGPIHIVHNNAATKTSDLKSFFAPLEHYRLETWRKVMAVNIDAYFLVAQEFTKRMIRGKIKGSVIQTASIYGSLGPDARIYEGSWYQGSPINTPAVYSASKGAVLALTKYLATHLANYGIRVNSLTPGGVQSGQNTTFEKKYSARVPLDRMARPEEMVGALIYLASEASSYVTGHNLIVDGGLHAW